MEIKILLGALVICTISVGVGRLTADQRGYSRKSVQHGEYLVNALASCGHCHTPLKRGRPDASRTMAGGTEFKGNWGVSYAANLTPDRETGLGEWTDQQIIRAIRNGIDDNGEKLTPPMPYANYHRITDRDIRDIVAYLRSLKAVRNQVPETHPAREPSAH